MPAEIASLLTILTHVIELIGALVLLLGFARASLIYARRWRTEGAFERYRRGLGQTVLIGLEILVAATIIRTITLDQTLASIGVLAAMVAVRTLISWSIALEIDGRWPWQLRSWRP